MLPPRRLQVKSSSSQNLKGRVEVGRDAKGMEESSWRHCCCLTLTLLWMSCEPCKTLPPRQSRQRELFLTVACQVTNTVGKMAQLKWSGVWWFVVLASERLRQQEVLRSEEPTQCTKTLPQVNKPLCSQQLYSDSLCCYPDHVYTLQGNANQ